MINIKNSYCTSCELSGKYDGTKKNSTKTQLFFNIMQAAAAAMANNVEYCYETGKYFSDE